MQLKNESRKLNSHLDTVVPEELTYTNEVYGLMHMCVHAVPNMLIFSAADLNCFYFLAGCSEAAFEFQETFWKTSPFQRAFWT